MNVPALHVPYEIHNTDNPCVYITPDFFRNVALFQWLCLRTVHANSNELSPETRLFDDAFQSE